MATIARDDFLKWCMFKLGQPFVKDAAFKAKVQGMTHALGAASIYSLEPENRIPFMNWIERELKLWKKV